MGLQWKTGVGFERGGRGVCISATPLPSSKSSWRRREKRVATVASRPPRSRTIATVVVETVSYQQRRATAAAAAAAAAETGAGAQSVCTPVHVCVKEREKTTRKPRNTRWLVCCVVFLFCVALGKNLNKFACFCFSTAFCLNRFVSSENVLFSSRNVSDITTAYRAAPQVVVMNLFSR